MKTAISSAILCAFLMACRTSTQTKPALHDEAHRARPTVADIAVNLGLRHYDDLMKLYDSLASAGVRCGIRAMSLDAAQIIVERATFAEAKAAVTNIIVRDRLTVPVYQSPDFGKSPESSLMDVWENGKKVREEEYKLYLSPYKGRHYGQERRANPPASRASYFYAKDRAATLVSATRSGLGRERSLREG